MMSQPSPRGLYATAVRPVALTATSPGLTISRTFPLPKRSRKGRNGSLFKASLSSSAVIVLLVLLQQRVPFSLDVLAQRAGPRQRVHEHVAVELLRRVG